jgi:hypothetical protein
MNMSLQKQYINYIVSGNFQMNTACQCGSWACMKSVVQVKDEYLEKFKKSKQKQEFLTSFLCNQRL